MSTVTVVRKDGVAAIAADTLTKYGGQKESALYVVNHEKIVSVGDSFLGITGPAQGQLAIADYFETRRGEVRLDTPLAIYREWVRLHRHLKEHHYLLPEEDEDDAFESTRVEVAIANPFGIFCVAAHRAVEEFTRFYAVGQGASYAMGAMHAVFENSDLSAEEIARIGVAAAAAFDDGTDLPATVHTALLR